jgi:Protein of unknown function (DUF2961)
MKKLSLLPLCMILCQILFGQPRPRQATTPPTWTVLDELQALSNLPDLPLYRRQTGEYQTSSYDRTGGNDDGFEGTYSFLRRYPDSSLLLFDAQGAGVINRIWTPTPTRDTLDFYIDDSTRPRLSICFEELFTGKVFPFLEPLSGEHLGGCYTYFPILFQHYCQIRDRGKQMQFYQIQYRLFRPGTPLQPFSTSTDLPIKAAYTRISQVWDSANVAAPGSGQSQHLKYRFTLLPGETKQVFTAAKGGRVTNLRLWPASAFAGLAKDIDICIYWDLDTVPAVDCPVADFFGYAFGDPAMTSLLLGTDKDTNYCRLPMPFAHAAKIELVDRREKGAQPLEIGSAIDLENAPQDTVLEGRLYTSWRSETLTTQDPYHLILQTSGEGHYIGTILQAQGLHPGMTSFFEGDDSTVVDGQMVIHGTGSEDYFNGGWYACPDRWAGRYCLPLFGCLDYSLPLHRTAGYRFYLSDKIPFEKDFFQSIEHGLNASGIPAIYTSLSFYYGDRSVANFQRPSPATCQVFIPDTLMLYPQLFQYNVWGSLNARAVGTNFHIGGRSYIYSADAETRMKLDLSDIPPGHYRLYADLVKYEDGCFIKVLQGQTEHSSWIDTHQTNTEREKGLYLCDIDITNNQRSMTFLFQPQPNANSFFLNRLILVRQP